MPNTEQKRNYGPLLLVLTAMLWSTGGVLTKSIPWNPISIVCARGLIAACVQAIYMRKIKFTINRPIILSAICLFGTSTTYVVSSKLTTAGNATALQNVAPLFIIIMSIIIYKQRPSKLEIGVSGLILVSAIFAISGTTTLTALAGDLISIIGGVFFAGVFFVNRLPGADPVQSVILGNAMFVVFLPSLIFDQNIPGSEPSAFIAIVFLGVFQIGAAWLLFSKGIKTTPALQASLITMLEPLLSPIWAFLFLGEMMSTRGMTGSAILLTSILTYNILSLKLQGKTKITPQQEREQLAHIDE